MSVEANGRLSGVALRVRLFLITLAGLAALGPGLAFAHGAGSPEPSLTTLLTGWQFDPLFVLPLILVTWLYLEGVRRLNRLHPKSPFPRRRVVYFLMGIGALILALASPIAAYDTDLFAVHMVQHMLMIMVAAPLLLLGTPIVLALRVASPSVRKNTLLPILHSRVVRAVSFPVLAWGLLAMTLWLTHYSELFNVALENIWAHRLEHTFYMTVALLFWWPVVSAEPSPWRLNHPVRMLYVFLQMPQSSFLAVSIYNAQTVIFPHYRSVARTWGPSPVTDQAYAGVIMWIGGDVAFLVALTLIAYGWVKYDEREARRIDRRLARERAAKLALRTAEPRRSASSPGSR